MKKVVFTSALFIITISNLFAFEQQGVASWYGGKFQGRKTASGEIFDTHQMTAAHKELPFGTIVTVVNLENGKEIQVRINDRGPYAKNRILDLSLAAAEALGVVKHGTANVKIKADASVADAINYCYIQVAAYKNVRNAAKLKSRLQDAGLSPYAVMTKEGIIRIEIRNVHKNDAKGMVEKLKKLGVESPLIKI